jgi:hypothetical protein
MTRHYRVAFTALASEVVEDICRDFEIDIAVFRAANTKLAAFIEGERHAGRVGHLRRRRRRADVRGERIRPLARARVSARRLAGVDVPFEVPRSWKRVGRAPVGAAPRPWAGQRQWNAAVRTLDDMLWSIVAKERTAQKARLTKMIPALIGACAKAVPALGSPPDRARAFFESLYELHIAAIRPKAEPAPTASAAAGCLSAATRPRRRRRSSTSTTT